MKRFFTVVLVVIVVIVLAGVVLALTINVDTYRPKLQAEMSKALGRQVTIGKLGLSIFSGRVVADNIAIADDPSFSKDPFLTAKEVKIHVALMPLIFSHTLQIDGLTIANPDIALLHTSDGTWNYASIGKTPAEANTGENANAAESKNNAPSEKKPAETKKPQAAKSQKGAQPEQNAGSKAGAKNMNLSVEALDIVNGKVTVGEAHTRKGLENYNNVNLHVRNFSATSEFPVTLSLLLPGSGTLNLDGSAGPINASDASLTPLKGKLTIASLDLSKSGYIDRSSGMEGLANVDIDFHSDGKHFTGDTSAKVDRLKVGKTGAPATVPVAVKCAIVHDLKQQSGVINNGSLDLGKTAAHFNGNYKLQPTTDLNLTLTGDNMPVDDLAPLLPAFGVTFPEGSRLEGGTFTVNLKASGPVDKLVTTGNVKLADTKLAGFNLGKNLAAVASLTGMSAGPDTDIQNLSSDLKISPEGIQTTNMDLDVPSLGNVTGNGTISPSNQLNYQMQAKLTGHGGGALSAISSAGGAQMPFFVKGTTSKPIIEPDVKAMAKSKVNSLISGALGQGSGNTAQQQNPVKSLKGLFGKK